MSIARKTWLGPSGAPMTHGELMTAVAKAKGVKIEYEPDAGCDGVLEQRGYREINDDGVQYVDWFGSRTHVILHCPSCNPDIDHPAYVTTVTRAVQDGGEPAPKPIDTLDW